MGSSPRAHLAYGCDLGSGENFLAAERNEYGTPKLPWLPVDEDGYAQWTDFVDEAEEQLLKAADFTDQRDNDGYYTRRAEALNRIGVEIYHSGADESRGWVLISIGSERNVEWDEVMTLDVDELRHEDRLPGWSKSLADALVALGITPEQKTAKWLVFPSYG